MCGCGKVRYYSRKEARKAARRLLGSAPGHTHGRLSAYKCDWGFWHLGHLPPKVIAGLMDRSEIQHRYWSAI